MKSFLKYTLATIVGFFLTLLIVFFIFSGIVGTLMSTAKKPVQVAPSSVLHLKLNYPIKDRGSDNPLENFDFTRLKPSRQLGLNEILQNIEKASEDDRIKGILLDVNMVQSGMATINEIRDALQSFQDSGKYVVAYGDMMSQKTYYLASIADSVYVNPAGSLILSGMSNQVIFIKGLLEKLGLEPQIVRHGKYKSAVEPLIQKEMSEANREQVRTYMGSLWNYMRDSMAAARSVNPELIDQMADELASLADPAIAVDKGLIDGVKYRDEVYNHLKILTGIAQSSSLDFVSMVKYNQVPAQRHHKGLIRDKIGVVYAEGDIVTGKGDGQMVGADRIAETLKEVRNDASVKAIVLRINSPGGSALASDIIWREVQITQKVKPVIASFGNVAASGGYYIAAAADTIVANPNTITGSIGVFGLLINAREFMNDKLGITSDVVKTNDMADIGTPFRPLTQAERAVIKKGVERTYDDFIGHVAEGRGLSRERVDELGQGRVWSGINARNNGLVDLYGGLNRAIAVAAERAGLEQYRVTALPKAKDPFQQMLEGLTGNVSAYFIKKELGEKYRYYKQYKARLHQQGILMQMPYDVSFD